MTQPEAEELKPCPFKQSHKLEKYVDGDGLKVSCKSCGIVMNFDRWQTRAPIQLETVGQITGDTSDGYHTFNELYEHRHILFLAVLTANIQNAWRSKLHADGTMFDGWFIAGLNTEDGQATYHLPLRIWELFKYIPELEKAPEWDGHTSNDVLTRIRDMAFFNGVKAHPTPTQAVKGAQYSGPYRRIDDGPELPRSAIMAWKLPLITKAWKEGVSGRVIAKIFDVSHEYVYAKMQFVPRDKIAKDEPISVEALKAALSAPLESPVENEALYGVRQLLTIHKDDDLETKWLREIERALSRKPEPIELRSPVDLEKLKTDCRIIARKKSPPFATRGDVSDTVLEYLSQSGVIDAAQNHINGCE